MNNTASAIELSSTEVGYALRSRFPYFQSVEPDRSAYLDSAASSLKLGACIKRLSDYLSFEHANIHRGAYQLSVQATENYESARESVKRFCNVPKTHEVIFTAGATDSFNLLSLGMEGGLMKHGTGVLSTLLEHHSNFVPWQQLAKRSKSRFLTAKITADAELDIFDFLTLLTENSPTVAAFTAHSNAFGTLPPLSELVSSCKRQGCISVVDSTQLVAHGGLDVSEVDADFFGFSAHKLYGPTGLGVLIGRRELLEQLNPVRTGGGMISEVREQHTSWAEIPLRFEAGTPPIGEAISLEATLAEIENIHGEFDLLGAEQELFQYAVDRLSAINGVQLIGPLKKDQRSILSFLVDGIHPHDMATIADSNGAQVRAGHHCVMPGMNALGIPATTRLSLGMYSVREDVDRLVEAIGHAQKLFR